MKVLTATKETQGQRKNDFCWTEEGEIVRFFVMECDGETADGRCGCKRCMCGTISNKTTTTMKIEERDLTMWDLENIMLKSLKESGWIKEVYSEEDEQWAREMAIDNNKIAEAFEVGMVVEKRGRKFQERHSDEKAKEIEERNAKFTKGTKVKVKDANNNWHDGRIIKVNKVTAKVAIDGYRPTNVHFSNLQLA